MFSRLLDPTNDYAFKKLFGTEQHKKAIIAFLNDILVDDEKLPIVDVTFLNTNHDPASLINKPSSVDVMCKDTVGHKYVVEMQMLNHPGFVKRCQYYGSKTYSQQVIKGTEYEHLKEVVLIAICNFNLFKDKKEFISYHVTLDKKTQEHDLKELSYVFIELAKFKKKATDLETYIDKWCYFFKHAQETSTLKIEELMKDHDIISYVHKALNDLALNEKDLIKYEAAEKACNDQMAREQDRYNRGLREGMEKGVKEGMEKGVKEGMEKGIKEGMEKGKEEGKEEGIREAHRKTIQALLESDFDKENILKIMKISEEEYERLIDLLRKLNIM